MAILILDFGLFNLLLINMEIVNPGPPHFSVFKVTDIGNLNNKIKLKKML